GATMGEQVSVTRARDGRLLVAGVLDTAKRRSEIVNALRPVAANPAISIDLVTAAEAMKRQRQADATSGQRYEFSEDAATGVQSAVRAFLKRRGVTDDQLGVEVRRFGDRVLALSSNSLRHAWALRRISDQFSAEAVASLSLEARTKRLEMVRQHAQAIQSGAEHLRLELQPVFGSAGVSAADAPLITSEADMMTTVKRLVATVAASDQLVRSAFTVSTGQAGAVDPTEVLQSLKRSEQLAERVKAARVE
ncbi:MAG TPA: hypothetical protein VFV34_26565, partial [Blastocatellia bacterium]|nr:hypothetical protein [Blastocatellia bacterium]